jgi:hypothetical protein
MRSRQRNYEIVFRQLGRTKQDRTALRGIEPETEKIVWYFNGESIGKGVVPGCEHDRIGLGHLEMKDRHQRLARRVRGERIQSVGLGLLAHNMAREARRMPLGRGSKSHDEKHLRRGFAPLPL